MIEQAPGITRLLDRLDAKGLVGRARCLADRRQVLCTITERGLALLEELDEPVDTADQRVLEGLVDAEVTSLVRLLERVRTGLD
jgi:DNA-binding MarR family transcriptional regulator